MDKTKKLKRNLLLSTSVLAVGALASSGAWATALTGNITADDAGTHTMTGAVVILDAVDDGDSITVTDGSGAQTLTFTEDLTLTGTDANDQAQLTQAGSNNTEILVTSADDSTDDITLNAFSIITSDEASDSNGVIDLQHTIGNITIAENASITTTDENATVIGVTASKGFGTLTNAGTITAHGTGSAVHFVGAATASIVNSGTISASASTQGVINIDGTLTGSITNSAGGTISATGAGVAIEVGGSVTGGVSNSGTLSTATGSGINVSATSTIDITNNSGGAITATSTGDGINIGAAITGTITNAGTISSGGTGANQNAIDIGSTVSGGITNSSGGTIEATAGGGDAIDLGADVAITNAGTISSTTGDAINVSATVASTLTNSSGGLIQSDAGIGVMLGGADLGKIDNTGTITDISSGTAIDYNNNTLTNGLVNNSGGVISSATGIAIDLDNDADSDITNAGTITSSSNTGAAAIAITGASTGDITNSGTISNKGSNGEAIDIGADLTGTITNTGTIELTESGNSGNGVIYASADAEVSGGIVNSGTIDAESSVKNAINLSLQTTDSTAGVVAVNNSGTINGAIVLGSGNTIRNTGTITGNISDGDNGDDTLQWYGGTIDGTINLGSQTGDNIDIGDESTDSISTGGDITGVALIDVDNGTFNIGHDITLTHTTETSEIFTVDSGATANFTDSKTLTAGTIAINGDLTVAAGKTATFTGDTSVSTTTFGANSTTNIAITTSSNFGQIDANNATTGTVNLTEGTTLNFNVSPTQMIIAGELTDIIVADDINYDGSDLSSSNKLADAKVTDDSWVLEFTASTNSDATGLDVTVARTNSYDTASTNTNETNVGAALETIANSGDADLDSVVAALDDMPTADEVAAGLVTLTPDMSGLTSIAANASNEAVVSTITSRLDNLRASADGYGIATGDSFTNKAIWGQVFGGTADQDADEGVRGYEADHTGFAIGFDTALDEQTRVGVSFAYAKTDSDSDSNVADAEIDSFQGTVYGARDFERWYVEGLASIALHDYDTSRRITVGAISSTANGDFDGQQYTFRVGGGYRHELDNGLRVTPRGSLQYSLLSQDNYTETGSVANLTVDNENVASLQLSLGGKLQYPITHGTVSYIPELGMELAYDILGDEQETTSNFTSATGTTFISKGADVDQLAFRLGAGLDILAQDNLTLSFDYDLELRSDYSSHAGAVKAKFAF